MVPDPGGGVGFGLGLLMDSWDGLTSDIDGVFGFRKDDRPQDRAHAYIERRKVMRGFNDTALQVAATDMCRRAFDLGRADALAGIPGLQEAAAEVTEVSGRLLRIACDLRGVRHEAE